jgi:hypothetical protein
MAFPLQNRDCLFLKAHESTIWYNHPIDLELLYMRFQLFCIVSCALLLACRPPLLDHVPELTVVHANDLREYTRQGFLFTPGSYSGDFESIGIIRLTTYPAANLVTVERERMDGSKFADFRRWQLETIDSDNMLKSIKLKCEEMGADALTHLKMETVFRPLEFSNSETPLNRSGVQVSGFAIKRLEAFDE